MEESLKLWLRPIRILVTSANGGMIEVVGGAVSLHQTKKQAGR
jgi:phosphatidylinositol kinase/protein kinase (PI-3  family)